MRKALLLGAALIALPSAAALLDPPSLRCASVEPNGDVILTWGVPPDPNNDFQEYIVYKADALAGPYAPIASFVVYGTSIITHVGADADLAQRFYYVTTVSQDPPPNESVPSDTLGTMFLTVNQSTPLGSAVLDWTRQHIPPIPTAGAQINIELEYPQGSWTEVDAIATDLHDYEQVISICEDSLTYRVALTNQLGCVSYSSRDGAIFQDVTAPTPPTMVTISVDTATNLAVLNWSASPEGDTDGYIIFYIEGGNNYIVDTIYGQNNTTFTWSVSEAGLHAETYTVAAFDTCYSGDPPAPNTSATNPPHTSIFTSTTYDRCEAVVAIDWTPYGGWEVSNYQIYATLNGGSPVLLGSSGPNTTSFQQEDVEPFTNYCYVVRAVGTSPAEVALSNLSCRLTDYPPVPQTNYLRVATVAAEDHIVIVDSVDQNAHAGSYHLERTFNGEPWEEIAVQGGSMSPTVVFNDLEVETALRSYTYRIVVHDSCGQEVLTSNEGSSILLIAEPGIDGINRLHWNGYGDWAGAVSGYAVHRSIAGGAYTPIAFNAPTDWDLEDDVNTYYESNGRFCYYVEALEAGNPAGIDAVSTSNEACAVQQEAVWIPNAFIQGGVNNAFKPVFAFADVEGYQLIIFNRWGQEIWSTTDPDEAWKGTVNDNYVPQGVYAYYCSFYNGAGKQVEERGTVTFLCCE